MLQEVHVEVILTLHSFLNAQLEDVGEVAGGIKPQIHYRISNAGFGYKKGKGTVRRRSHDITHDQTDQLM